MLQNYQKMNEEQAGNHQIGPTNFAHLGGDNETITEDAIPANNLDKSPSEVFNYKNYKNYNCNYLRMEFYQHHAEKDILNTEAVHHL